MISMTVAHPAFVDQAAFTIEPSDDGMAIWPALEDELDARVPPRKLAEPGLYGCASLSARLSTDEAAHPARGSPRLAVLYDELPAGQAETRRDVTGSCAGRGQGGAKERRRC